MTTTKGKKNTKGKQDANGEERLIKPFKKLQVNQLATTSQAPALNSYITLEEDLISCFQRRGIYVKELKVSNRAKTYTIQVRR